MSHFSENAALVAMVSATSSSYVFATLLFATFYDGTAAAQAAASALEDSAIMSSFEGESALMYSLEGGDLGAGGSEGIVSTFTSNSGGQLRHVLQITECVLQTCSLLIDCL